MNIAQIFMFDFDVVRAECMVESMSGRYIIQGLFPLLPAAVFLVVSLKPVWKDRAYNVIGVFYSIAYIFLCRISFKIFECADIHPYAPATVLQFPDVYCGEDERKGLIWLGVVLFILYPIGLVAVFTALCYIAPEHFHDEKFRMRTTFLLSRWRPSAWWFSPVFMFRSFCVSATLLVYPMEGSMQLSTTAVILAIYLVFLSFHMPYRGFLLNATDATITLSMLGVCTYALGIGVTSTDLDVDRRIIDYGFFFVISLLLSAGVPIFVLCRMGVRMVRKKPGTQQKTLEDTIAIIKEFRETEMDDKQLGSGLRIMLSEDERANLHQQLSVVLREICEREVTSPKKRLFMSQTTGRNGKPSGITEV